MALWIRSVELEVTLAIQNVREGTRKVFENDKEVPEPILKQSRCTKRKARILCALEQFKAADIYLRLAFSISVR